jgi:hypothetical protein
MTCRNARPASLKAAWEKQADANVYNIAERASA